jgi:hypothetical protein
LRYFFENAAEQDGIKRKMGGPGAALSLLMPIRLRGTG